MNTTTAAYAAEAAKSSCLLAVVSEDMAIPNTQVNTISTPYIRSAIGTGEEDWHEPHTDSIQW